MRASESFKLNIPGYVEASGKSVQGIPEGSGADVSGEVTGRSPGGRFGEFSAPTFATAISLTANGRAQAVSIYPRDGDVADVHDPLGRRAAHPRQDMPRRRIGVRIIPAVGRTGNLFPARPNNVPVRRGRECSPVTLESLLFLGRSLPESGEKKIPCSFPCGSEPGRSRPLPPPLRGNSCAPAIGRIEALEFSTLPAVPCSSVLVRLQALIHLSALLTILDSSGALHGKDQAREGERQCSGPCLSDAAQ